MASKEDIKVLLKEINNLRDENCETKKEVCVLKLQNKEVIAQLNNLKDRSRINNLIFKGLKHCKKDNAIQMVRKFCVEVLGARKDVFNNRAHLWGRNRKDRSINACIPSDSNIHYILKYTNKLRRTNYVIHRGVSKGYSANAS